MRTVRLLHNPKAGDKAHSKKKLVSSIESQGFECHYSSVKEKDWGDKEFEEDFLAIAGGDGTVRKVIAKLLERRLIDRNIPLAVLPLGTANNIAQALGLPAEPEAVVRAWRTATVRKFDIGRITGVPDLHFFLEGIGFGVFPNLMNKIKKHHKIEDEPPGK